MQKTKLGITVGLMGAIMCLAGLVSGYVVAILVAGYILLAEENVWLKKTAVKVIVLMVAFSALSVLINFIPNVFSVIESLLGIFNVYFSFTVIHRIFSFLNQIVNVLETVVFLVLGLKALSQGTIRVPFIDGLLDKHFG